MKLLHVICTLDPAYGGPVEVVRQLNLAHERSGHSVCTVTLDAPDAPWLDSFPGRVEALGPSRLGTYRYNPKLIPWLMQHAPGYDAVVAHGVWQFQSFATWRAARAVGFPYSVFVHGGLALWLKTNYPLKHLKKNLYWPWAEYRVLRDATSVLYGCEEERQQAGASFGWYRAREAITPLGVAPSITDPDKQRAAFLAAFPHLRDKRRVLFMGRLHAVKGCDLLIEAFARAAAHDPALHLVMVGPDQEGLQAVLASRAEALGIANRITWTGLLQGDLKWGALRSSEVFVLPSHSESFGLSAVEALACGVPVLLTDKVNIWREIEADGAGLVAPDTVQGVRWLLQRWLSLSPAARQRMAHQAQGCFQNRFEISRAAERFANVVHAPYCPVQRGEPAYPGLASAV